LILLSNQHVTLREYFEALRKAEEKFQTERDKRYTEVNTEKEKALKIKETADLMALQLAREIQTYKDEKANELREQINNERGVYATKDDLANSVDKLEATIRPTLSWIASQQGRRDGTSTNTKLLIGLSGLVLATFQLYIAFKISSK
jgi:vacuolar-type H+-ATPase subunit H